MHFLCGELSFEFSKLGSFQILDLVRNDFGGNVATNYGDLKVTVQAQKKNTHYYYIETMEVTSTIALVIFSLFVC